MRIDERIPTWRRPIDAADRGTGGRIMAEGYARPWGEPQSRGQRLGNENLVRLGRVPALDQRQLPKQAVAVGYGSFGRPVAERDYGVPGLLLQRQLRDMQRGEPGAHQPGGVQQTEARPGQQAHDRVFGERARVAHVRVHDRLLGARCVDRTGCQNSNGEGQRTDRSRRQEPLRDNAPHRQPQMAHHESIVFRADRAPAAQASESSPWLHSLLYQETLRAQRRHALALLRWPGEAAWPAGGTGGMPGALSADDGGGAVAV